MLQPRWRPAILTLIVALGLTVARAADSPTKSLTPDPVHPGCGVTPELAVSPCGHETCLVPTVGPLSQEAPSSCAEPPCVKETKEVKPSTTLVSSPAQTKDGDIEQCLGAVCSFHFSNTPLRQVLDDLRVLSGLNIIADEPALQEAGISLDRPVTLGLKGLPLKKGLELVLHQMHLTYVVKDDVLHITTPSHARGKLVTKMYAVEDLIRPVDRGRTGAPAQKEAPQEQMIQMITRTIAPQTWQELGGSGTMQYFPLGHGLAITQTVDIHEQVGELLAALRRLREHEAVATGPTCLPVAPGIVRVLAEPTQPPAPTTLCAATTAPRMPYVVHEAAKPLASSWAISVVLKEGRAYLEVPSSSDTRLLCKELLLETLAGQLQLSTCDRQIQVISPFFQAAADRLVRTDTEEGVLLEGRVWLQCQGDVQHAEVFAERILVSLKDGHLTIKPSVVTSGNTVKTEESN